MQADIYSTTPVSAYQPSKEVCDFTACVKKDWGIGMDILQRSYVELNDLSPIERDNRDRRTFNAFVDESIEDKNRAWEWIGTRSKARNKAIAMHSQLTAGYIVPMFMAQNDMDEEDRDLSDVMRDCSEWLVYNSNYRSSYLMASMGMLVNSVTYLGADWSQVMQKIKEKTEKGYTVTEIQDEVLSGFQAPVYSSDQILIANAFEQNIQRHRFNILTEYVEYSEVKAKYQDHENFQYVRAGFTSVYNDELGVFYDVADPNHRTLVRKDTYKNRLEDTEVCFLGGIYMGEADIEANPIRHRDNRNAPKYNVVPFGYQRVNEHFFFYKSLMNSQYWDNELLDAQYKMGMNRLFLDGNMPIAVSGTDKIDSEIIFPNSVVSFKDKDAKATRLLPDTNFGNIFSGMAAVESSMDESSVSGPSAGQLPQGDQKATGIAIAERNAKTLLQGVGKTLAESIVQYGSLMADIIIQHLSVAQVDEITGESAKIKYKSLILKDKVVGGKSVSKVIRFDDTLLGREMTKKKKESEALKLLEKTGYPENSEAIYRVNPELFSRMKYLVRVEPEKMFPKNEEFMQAMYLEILAQMKDNPYVSLEALTRKTLYQFFRGDTDEIMQKMKPVMDAAAMGEGGPVAGDIAKKSALQGGLANKKFA
jgi:hypothetical protein